MKHIIGTAALFAVCSLPFARLEAQADEHDPTRPAAAMADALKAQLTDAEGLRLHALVVGAAGEGVALVGRTAAEAVAVRRGSVLPQVVDGVKVEVAIRSVSVSGVELDTSAGGRRVFLPGSFTPLAAPTNAVAEFIRYLECERVPLGRLLRLVADQAGVNISASDATADKTVSIFLRNVTAAAAVEEICRGAGLWFRREPDSGMIRVTTMAEYSEGLRSFREETTETFTLLYPNVIEVASVIYGLYPDRTLLSLGEEEFQEDDEYELSRRFQRFRVIEENGNSQFMDMQAPRATSSGSRSGSGVFSFSRGSALSHLQQWDRLRGRGRYAQDALVGSAATGLTADEARRIERAYSAADTNGFERAFGDSAPAAASVFVTMSRKNNMLIVRTSDVAVMDEIRKLIRRLDVPTPMVLMEVKVLELTIDDSYTAKFQYSFDGHARGIGGPNPNVFGDVVQSGLTAVEPTFAFKALSDHIDMNVEMMQGDGKVKVLATPTLLTANNEVSRIFRGKQYPLVTGWTSGGEVVSQGVFHNVASTPQIERKDVGDMLLITPNINADRTVTLRLLQESSTVNEAGAPVVVEGSTSETGSVKRIQFVESRSIAGTFVAKDGMTVMAGGLISEREKEVYSRTPILGSIPLIGFLFRGTEKVKERSELIVLIKPHVIMAPVRGGKVSDELLKRLSSHPAADGRANMGVFIGGDEPAAEKRHSVLDDLKQIVE